MGAVFMHAEISDGYEAEVARAIQRALVEQLMTLAAGAPMPQVRAITTAALSQMADHIGMMGDSEEGDAMMMDADAAHMAMLAFDIERFLDRDLEPYSMPRGIDAPPGAPIGQPAMNYIDPVMTNLPPMGSLLDLLVPVEPSCSIEH